MTKKELMDSLKTAKTFPNFRVGDTVKVHVKIKEGEKERVQIFEGLVIKKRGGTTKGASFMVRKISYGIGVERVFPFESKAIEQIEIVKQGKVRRSKLYYIRALRGKASQIEELERHSPSDEGEMTPPKVKAAAKQDASAALTT